MAVALGGAVAGSVHLGASLAAASRTRASPTSAVAPASPAARRAPQRMRSHLDVRNHHSKPSVYAGATSHRVMPRLRDIPARVYVPNTLSATVDVINPRTFRVIRRIGVGALPHHVTPSWDLRRLYVDNTDGNSLSVIDPRTSRISRTVHVVDPYNLYFTPDGTKAIVVAERYRRIDFRNPRTWRLKKSVPVPGSGPDHLDLSRTGRYLLISTEWSGWVFRVNTKEMKVTGRVEVGGLPVDVKVGPDGSTFYVANQGLNGVSVIDGNSMKLTRFIPTGAGAHGLCVSRDARRLYVSNRLAGTISVISLATSRKIATWHVGGSPDMMQVLPNGRQLWTTNRYNGSVSVISTAGGRVLHTIAVGSEPHGLSYFPQPGRVSVGHNGVYR